MIGTQSRTWQQKKSTLDRNFHEVCDFVEFDTHRTYRAYRGAEAAADADHVLVAADLVFTIMKPKKTDEVRRPYDIGRLSSSSEL